MRAAASATLTLAAFFGAAYLFRDEWYLLVLLPLAGLYASGSALVQRLSLPSRARSQVSFVRPPERAPSQQSAASLWRGPD